MDTEMIVDTVKFMITTLLMIFITVIVPLAIAVNLYTGYICDKYEELTGTRTEYVSFDSCYVESKGKLTRWEEYMNQIIAEKGLSK